MAALGTWKVCSICRNTIAFQAVHYVCSVSTCQRKRTGLVFCSPACFDAHLPMMRHRDAWAEKVTAPTEAEAAAEAAEEADEAPAPAPAAGARRIIAAPAPAPQASAAADAEDEVLIVTSRLKKFIKTQSGMNTSDSVLTVLSEHIRTLSVEALRQAAADGRKTVLDRDYEAVLRALRSR